MSFLFPKVALFSLTSWAKLRSQSSAPIPQFLATYLEPSFLEQPPIIITSRVWAAACLKIPLKALLKLKSPFFIPWSEVLVAQSCLFATPGTIAYQAPLSLEFSRQEYWSGLPFPSPRDLPNPRIEPGSPALRADSLLSDPPGKLPLFLITYQSFLGLHYDYFLLSFFMFS